MASQVELPSQHPSLFRLFTKESLTKIERRIAEEAAAKEAAKELQEETGEEREESDDEKRRPDPALEQGKPLPTKLGEFPPELFGKPIEDIDEFYDDKMTFVVVARDKVIYRFSATSGFFCLSPFNPIRRAAIYVLTHPFFMMLVMIVILVNCVFMASNQDVPHSELIFTIIYTFEGSTKMLSRGFIFHTFSYLRDAWNWLDFVVVVLAYITMFVELGNLAALRTFRVLRALKTVAVVPGLKTIVGALMEAVRRLRDVGILTVFILSIFALTGLQIYQGTLKQKCVHDPPPGLNLTLDEIKEHNENETNWFYLKGAPKLCGMADDAGQCPPNHTCISVGPNPNYDYTSFDNFAWAFLCSFRLMTQDYWENLYQIVSDQRPLTSLFPLIAELTRDK
ncbi:hypothetical protein NP493_188g08074 [Ridgeia piscesae]|uniref:Ion transport domain-containing protein n=1 Tax=Ridgeia piscesae TaxID=27915 RepID=A0AAD9P267_RIDPI|nr:hypothetical protein NP493_188g08074 [Ridgeia piscesae]